MTNNTYVEMTVRMMLEAEGNQRLSFPEIDGSNFISAKEIRGDESEMNCELSNAVNALIVFESDSKVDAGTFPSTDHSPSHISTFSIHTSLF